MVFILLVGRCKEFKKMQKQKKIVIFGLKPYLSINKLVDSIGLFSRHTSWEFRVKFPTQCIADYFKYFWVIRNRKTNSFVCCCCFSTGTLQGDECSQANPGIIQLRNCTMAFRGRPYVTLLLHLYWRGCLIIHVLLNLQVHTMGMSLASSGKFV